MINLLTFVVAFLASAINAIPILRTLIQLKSNQTVSQFAPETHQKKQGTPTMGGLIVAIGFVIGGMSFVLANPNMVNSPDGKRPAAIILLFIGFGIIGFIDDYVVPRMIKGKRGLGWKQKISMQLVVAAGCAWLLCGEASPAFYGLIFLVLFFSNAYNFADGLDALAALLLIGLGGGLFIIAHMRDAVTLETILLALLGAILPFLYLNRPPAKIFMGDTGSLPIGAVLGAAVAILLFPNDFDYMYVHPLIGSLGLASAYYRPNAGMLMYVGIFIISGMMIVELVPVPLQILSVKLRKKKLFSFTPIHHAFEKKGWPERKVVAVFVGCQLAMSLIAIACADNSTTAVVIVRNLNNQHDKSVKWHQESLDPQAVQALGG